MRGVVQRVKHGKVTVNGEVVGQIDRGIVLLISVEDSDEDCDLEYMVDKIPNLRIFEDNDGKMNRSLIDVSGSILIVSQFTLHGDSRKGRRPSFIKAARPEKAIPFYERLIKSMRELGIETQTGEFGADMEVLICNDGPVTILLDSKKVF